MTWLVDLLTYALVGLLIAIPITLFAIGVGKFIKAGMGDDD